MCLCVYFLQHSQLTLMLFGLHAVMSDLSDQMVEQSSYITRPHKSVHAASPVT